jgi:hypothetical protein
MRTQARVRTVGIVAAVLAGACQAFAQTGDAGDGEAGAVVADQVRSQGLACAEPATATRDPSVDDDSVWMLTCADARYRVRLIPDQAAVVEQLD